MTNSSPQNDTILENVRERIGEEEFQSWFSSSHFKLQGDRLLVSVPNRYIASWISDNYHQEIGEIGGKFLGKPVTIEYRVNHSENSPINKRESTIDPELTFANFIKGDSNNFAAAAAENVANNPASHHNPLFIFSDVGLGKTHLLHSIGNRIQDRDPKARVLYLRAEDFYQQMIDALRTNSIKAFQEQYRNRCDVLLVDDVQFFAGKSRSSDEFFHTFNALHMARRQIVLTADKKPHELEMMEERLRSRFGMGLVADIEYPDDETRMAILLKKADEQGLRVPQDVAFFIASYVRGNIRDLLGCFKRVMFLHRLKNCDLSVEFARQVLHDYLGEQQRSLSVEAIAAHVATYFNLKVTDLKSRSRKKALSQPRHIAMFLSRELVRGATFQTIGDFYNRDHSTVIEAVRKIEGNVNHDVQLKEQLDSLKKGLGEMTG